MVHVIAPFRHHILSSPVVVLVIEVVLPNVLKLAAGLELDRVSGPAIGVDLLVSVVDCGHKDY